MGGGGRLDGVGRGFGPGGGVPRWGGLHATHYYKMHTPKGDVCLGQVWGSCWWLLRSRGCKWASVSTVVVVIFTSQQTTLVLCLVLLLWRSKRIV